jgi:sugar O-acyltransferase (sialic acid O-acetyltransferase NeuD family)
MSGAVPIVVIGASGLAKVVIDAIERAGRHPIAGLIDVRRSAGDTFFGYPVLGDDDDAARLFEAGSFGAAVIAIGDNWRRHLVAERWQRAVPHLQFPPVVDPSVHVGRGASVGRGTIVMSGVAVGCDTRLGDFVLCDYRAAIAHDCRVGDFATLACGTAIAGGVDIGSFSVLSVGASVIHGVSIGEHTVIGAGATVVDDIGERVVAVGTPAAVMRQRQVGDAYL